MRWAALWAGLGIRALPYFCVTRLYGHADTAKQCSKALHAVSGWLCTGQMASAPKAPAKKYDRQLRIWGAHGQQALETARVCVLGGGCTATEALKNLVLGGIAGFTVVDNAIVQASDLGANFLLENASLGKARAAAVTELLAELNEGVASSYVEEAPINVIESNPAFFSDFQLVLATQVHIKPREYWNRLSPYFQGFKVTLLTYADEGARPDTA